MFDRSALEDLAPTADLRPLGGGRRSDPVTPGLVFVAAAVAVAYAGARLIPALSPLVLAVAVGAALANLGLVPRRARAGLHLAAKRLLRLGVVLLGCQLAVGEVLRLGGPGLAVVVAVVTTTFFGTQWLGRRLGVSPSLSLLIATGFSICGASAVAAVEGVSEADEEEVAFAIALVTVCGSLAIGVLPVLAGPLGLHGGRFGAWVGASVHDIAQVVATASTGGTTALHHAVVVKLTRIVLLAPVVAGVTLQHRRRTRPSLTPTADPGPADVDLHRPPVVPLFVAGFLGAIALRSSGALPVGWLPAIAHVGELALAAALVGLGTGVDVAKLRRLGGRPLVLALLSWLLVGTVAYVGVLVAGA